MDRWYFVGVQATLFDDHAVICGWGRRGTAQARWQILPVDTRDQAKDLAQRIVNNKLQKGYCFAKDE